MSSNIRIENMCQTETHKNQEKISLKAVEEHIHNVLGISGKQQYTHVSKWVSVKERL